METRKDSKRAIDLARKIQDMIKASRESDPDLRLTHVSQALSVSVASCIAEVQKGNPLTVADADQFMKVFVYYVMESFITDFPEMRTPEVIEKCTRLQQFLRREMPKLN